MRVTIEAPSIDKVKHLVSVFVEAYGDPLPVIRVTKEPAGFKGVLQYPSSNQEGDFA